MVELAWHLAIKPFFFFKGHRKRQELPVYTSARFEKMKIVHNTLFFLICSIDKLETATSIILGTVKFIRNNCTKGVASPGCNYKMGGETNNPMDPVDRS